LRCDRFVDVTFYRRTIGHTVSDDAPITRRNQLHKSTAAATQVKAFAISQDMPGTDAN
jgi:hypothetical protein